MTVAPPPVRPVTLEEMRAARERIAPLVTRTPLIQLRHATNAPEIWLKLEILEDLPDVRTVIAAIGGGGLVAGIGSAIRAVAPHVRILGAEPETAAPGALSFEKGGPQVFDRWEASFVDGAGGKSIFPRMWERMQGIVDGSIVVTLDEVKRAMRMIAEKTRVIAEGAGALAVAAALSGKAGEGPIVAVISGGNIDLKKFAELIGVIPSRVDGP